MNATTQKLKAAWIRNPDVPAGQSAKGRLNCSCGNAPETDYAPQQGNIRCGCGLLYTWDGWVLPERKPYQPKTGERCSCRRGIERDNCPQCEGTGWIIDFRAIREHRLTAGD